MKNSYWDNFKKKNLKNYHFNQKSKKKGLQIYWEYLNRLQEYRLTC